MLERRGSVILFGILLGAWLPAGCTILQPSEPWAGNSFFRSQQHKQHIGEADCIDNCRQSVINLDGYVGELGYAISDADLNRRQLLARGAERMTLNTIYNATLWVTVPVIAAVDPSTQLLRNALAAAVAAYGLLNSGVPERDKLYIEASRRMACAIALATADLYPRVDIEGYTDTNKSPRRTSPTHEDSLDKTMLRLRNAINAYESKRIDVVGKLNMNTRKGMPESRTTVERRHDSVMGRSTASGIVNATLIQTYSDVTRRRLETAKTLLDELSTKYKSLQRAGERLRLRSSEVETNLTAALSARTPALVDPSVVAIQIANQLQANFDQTNAIRSATSSTVKGQGALQAWEANETTLIGLTRDSRDAVQGFEKSEAVILAQAIDAARRWKNDIEQREKTVRKSAADKGCTEALFTEVDLLHSPSLAAPSTLSTTGMVGGENVRPLEERR